MIMSADAVNESVICILCEMKCNISRAEGQLLHQGIESLVIKVPSFAAGILQSFFSPVLFSSESMDMVFALCHFIWPSRSVLRRTGDL
jgi:hypothetical protein